MMGESFFTYMLSCADGTLYTGWTTNLEARVRVHNNGKGARYTRSRLPVKLLASWSFNSRTEAMRFECHLKKLSRPQKLSLVEQVALESDSSPR